MVATGHRKKPWPYNMGNNNGRPIRTTAMIGWPVGRRVCTEHQEDVEDEMNQDTERNLVKVASPSSTWSVWEKEEESYLASYPGKSPLL